MTVADNNFMNQHYRAGKKKKKKKKKKTTPKHN